MKLQAKALFLDRDGVVNVDKNFVHTQAEFEWMSGIFELCRKAHEAGYLLVICTNQSGIGRLLYSESQFLALTEWMKQRFSQESAPLTAVYFCPFHPEAGKGQYCRPSLDRKPAPGMFLKARDAYHIDMQRSIAIGDTARDAEAAYAAGVGTILHLGQELIPTYVTSQIALLSEAVGYLK